MRRTGVTVRGIRTPIIKAGDDLENIVVSSVLDACIDENFTLKDHDVIAITESVVARSESNYCSIDDICEDVKSKIKSDTFGVIFPILSRNRFSTLLKGIGKAAKKIYLMLSYPSDEVGNHLISFDDMDKHDIDPYTQVLTLKEYREYFKDNVHPFTGIDYVKFYEDVIKSQNAEVEIIFANNPKEILKYTKYVITCDIHTRARTKRILKKANAEVVLGLDDICNTSTTKHGYNSKYGLLGSNLANDTMVKLFPEQGEKLCYDIKNKIYSLTSKNVEVMVYGDGAFKDPVGKIWELADPVVSPFYTKGLEGTPNEMKIKYLADNEFKDLRGKELTEAIKDKIAHKNTDLKGQKASLGTTPRQITDLLGSLCDLTSGSGDKGTPVVLVSGYFDNISNQ